MFMPCNMESTGGTILLCVYYYVGFRGFYCFYYFFYYYYYPCCVLYGSIAILATTSAIYMYLDMC